jgi:hypothetical protein
MLKNRISQKVFLKLSFIELSSFNNKILFETFSISEINIISVKLVVVLWYWSIARVKYLRQILFKGASGLRIVFKSSIAGHCDLRSVQYFWTVIKAFSSTSVEWLIAQ